MEKSFVFGEHIEYTTSLSMILGDKDFRLVETV